MPSVEIPCRVHMTHRGAEKRNVHARELLKLLADLVAELEGLNGDLNSACWADHDYEYIELTLSGDLDLELDLNVHGPRVRIRSNRGNH